MKIIVDLLKLNEETEFGNIWTDKDAELILNDFISKSFKYGELDPEDGKLNPMLSNCSHVINKIWLKDNRMWGEVNIINTTMGLVVKEIIGEDQTIFENLKAKNRDGKIDSILEDKDFKYIYPSDILKEKGLYFSLRGSGTYGKLEKFFTFDIRSYKSNNIC